MTSGQPESSDCRRLDRWLWFARLLKSRALATKTVEAGGVRLCRAGRTEIVRKPAFGVRVGDVVTLALPGRVAVVEVRGLGMRRGPAPEAHALYRDLTPAQPAAPRAYQPDRRSRPTKKERRAATHLKRIDWQNDGLA